MTYCTKHQDPRHYHIPEHNFQTFLTDDSNVIASLVDAFDDSNPSPTHGLVSQVSLSALALLLPRKQGTLPGFYPVGGGASAPNIPASSPPKDFANNFPHSFSQEVKFMLLPKLKSAFSYEMGLSHLSVHSLQNLRGLSGPLPYIFKVPQKRNLPHRTLPT